MKIQSSYLLTELERKKYLCDSFWGTLTLQDLDRDTFKKKKKKRSNTFENTCNN